MSAIKPIFLVNEVATLAAAKRFAAIVQPYDCITLQGDLGAGKTSFARGLIHALTPKEEPKPQVISPTFVLVQDYAVTLADGTRTTLYHLDAYRIEDPAELEEIGLAEMLEDGICLIEWPENCAEWLPLGQINLILDEQNNNNNPSQGRCLRITAPPSRLAQLALLEGIGETEC